MKCLPVSNKLLFLRWFKFLLLLINSLQNRITLLLVLKLLQFTKLTPCIHFFFFYFITMYLFLLSSIFFNLKKNKKKISLLFSVFVCVCVCVWLEKVKISNYNKCKLLMFTQKIKEPLSTRMSACLEASLYLLERIFFNNI